MNEKPRDKRNVVKEGTIIWGEDIERERESNYECVTKERKIDCQMKAKNSATLVTSLVSYNQQVENSLKAYHSKAS